MNPSELELRLRPIIERDLSQLKAARARVGGTATQRLHWLLDFVQVPRDQLKGQSLSRIHYDLRAFPASPTAWPRTNVLEEPNAEQIAKISETTREAIAHFVGGKAASFQYARYGRLDRTINARPFQSYYVGDYRDCFFIAVADLIAAEGRRIRECAWAPCPRLFAKRKRGAYCSTACSQKARTAKHRQSLGEKAWRDKRHGYYVLEIERTKGRAVAKKVGRRPAKTQGE